MRQNKVLRAPVRFNRIERCSMGQPAHEGGSRTDGTQQAKGGRAKMMKTHASLTLRPPALRPLTLGSLTFTPRMAVLLLLLALRPGSAVAQGSMARGSATQGSAVRQGQGSIPAVPAEVLAIAAHARTKPALTAPQASTEQASTEQASTAQASAAHGAGRQPDRRDCH